MTLELAITLLRIYWRFATSCLLFIVSPMHLRYLHSCFDDTTNALGGFDEMPISKVGIARFSDWVV